MRYTFPMSLEVKDNMGNVKYTYQVYVVAHDRDEAAKEFYRIMGISMVNGPLETEGVQLGDGTDLVEIHPYDEK